jgi:hypothetical protein
VLSYVLTLTRSLIQMRYLHGSATATLLAKLLAAMSKDEIVTLTNHVDDEGAVVASVNAFLIAEVLREDLSLPACLFDNAACGSVLLSEQRGRSTHRFVRAAYAACLLVFCVWDKDEYCAHADMLAHSGDVQYTDYTPKLLKDAVCVRNLTAALKTAAASVRYVYEGVIDKAKHAHTEALFNAAAVKADKLALAVSTGSFEQNRCPCCLTVVACNVDRLAEHFQPIDGCLAGRHNLVQRVPRRNTNADEGRRDRCLHVRAHNN